MAPGTFGPVGVLDIARIRAGARCTRMLDHTLGSGDDARATAARKLERATALLTRPIRDSLRSSLHVAVGDLAHALAFAAFDAHDFDAASCLNRFALDRVRDSGDWHLWAQVLITEARINIWTGRPQAGLRNARQALTAPDLTATERAMIHAVEARALAPMHDRSATLRAIGLADEAFAESTPSEDPRWILSYDAATHAGNVGHALSDLVLAGYPEVADEAVLRLADTMQAAGEGQNRSRIFATTLAATTVMAVGDPREAMKLGRDAMAMAPTVESARSRRLLQDLALVARTHHPDRPDVSEWLSGLVG